jgi:hypothetical protein
MVAPRYSSPSITIVSTPRLFALRLRKPTREVRTRRPPFELLLFLDETGWLKELEIVHYGDVIPSEFPPPSIFESPSVLC